MSEVINIATFNLDTQLLQKNLNELQNRYFDLRKEQKAYSDQSKEVTKEMNLLAKENKLLANSASDQSVKIAENDKKMQDLVKTQKELFKSEQNLGTQMGTVKKEINQTTTQLRAYQDAEGKTASLIDLGNAALGRQIKNKNEARAANIALNNVANQLNPNIKEEADLLVKLNKKMDENTQFIKENSSETAKQKMNIGNYTESVLEALRTMEAEKKALEDVKEELSTLIKETEKGSEAYNVYNQQLNILNIQINNFSDDIAKAKGESGGFNDILKLTEGGLAGFSQKAKEAGGAGPLLSGAFNSIKVGILGALKAGLAFMATPIGIFIAGLAVAVGLVVGAFKLAKASMQSTEQGTQKLAVVTGAITGIFKGLFNVVKPLGLFFAGVFIKTLENAGKVAEKTLGMMAKALDFLGFDNAAKGVRDFTTEVKISALAASNLAKAEGELTVQQRQARKIQLDYQKTAEKLRQQRDDETKSIAERTKINAQLGDVLKKQSTSELEIANKQLQVANLKIKAEGETTDALNARAEAQTNISDIQERITSQESEQLANLNSLRKEASDKQKELNAKAIDNALAKSKAEIDLFVAEQGFKRKSTQEQYDFNNALLKKETEDLKLQLKSKKISQIEYDAQLLNLKNQTLSANADLLIENANLEIDAQIAKNALILANDQYLSDEQLRIKQETLAANLLAETNYQELLLENGKINQAEFNAAINQINEENRLANLELAKVNKAAEQEKALIDLENQKIIQEENFLAQAELDKERNEIKLEQELANAEKTGADVQLIKDKYAQMDKDIDLAVMTNKLNLASQTFGQLSSILGENSKAGKAAAIAQATIDTYSGINSVWATKSILPEPLATAQKILSTVVVAKSGFDSVKKITATKQPTFKKASYASGVIGLRGAGNGTSDDINANLSAGESVINSRSTAMYASELSSINKAGGGVGLNGASNILNQNEIKNNVNNSQMASMIAEAVAVGAEAGTSKGSQQGMIGLSDNRKIMQDAKF